MSDTKLAATYLVYESKVRCYKVPYAIPNVCIVCISLKTLCLSVLASFANANKWNTAYICIRYICTYYHQHMCEGCGSAGSHSLAMLQCAKKGFCTIAIHYLL